MNIHSAVNSMKLQEFEKLLLTPAKVDYPNGALSKPKITWTKYTGSITLDELPELLIAAFDRNYNAIPKYQNFELRYSKQFEQINQFREAKEKVLAVSNKIIGLWKEKTFGKVGAFFQECDPVDKLRNKSFAIDRLEKTLKIELAEKRKIQRMYEEQRRRQEEEKIFEHFSSLFNNGFRSNHNTNTQQGNPFGANPFTFSSNGNNPSGNFFFFFEDGFSGNNVLNKQQQIDLSLEVMKLPKNATAKQIKKQYHKFALELHPDKNLNDPKAVEKFQELNNAYECLKKEYNIS